MPGKPISRADLTAKYGADSKDLDTVEKVLSAFGLTVLSKNLAARTVKLAGAASKMERAFGVSLLRVKHNDVVYRGRVGEIQIPAATVEDRHGGVRAGYSPDDQTPEIDSVAGCGGIASAGTSDRGSFRRNSRKPTSFPTATARDRRWGFSSSAGSTSRRTSSSS